MPPRALPSLGLEPGDTSRWGNADAARPWLIMEDSLQEFVRESLRRKLMKETIAALEKEEIVYGSQHVEVYTAVPWVPGPLLACAEVANRIQVESILSET